MAGFGFADDRSANPVERILKGTADDSNSSACRAEINEGGWPAGMKESVQSWQKTHVRGLCCNGLKIERLGVAEIAVVGDVQVWWIIDGAINHEGREVGAVEGRM